MSAITEGGEEIESLRDRIIGRVALDDIIDPIDGRVIVEVNQGIDEDLASEVQSCGIERVRIRSVLTCESRRGCCIRCYGRNLARGEMVDMGEAVGVIAAQSIGEPGTQLQCGHSTSVVLHVWKSSHRTKREPDGVVDISTLLTVKNRDGKTGGDESPGYDHRGR